MGHDEYQTVFDDLFDANGKGYINITDPEKYLSS
jgi:hypothetical protein